MAIPGVTPTQVLMSLGETDDQGNIGAALGYGSQAEKNYRSSLGGQMAPIYGKGGYQYATLAPFNEIFSLGDDTSDDTGSTVPIQRPVTDDSGSSSIFQDAGKIAQNIVQNPAVNQTTYGPITGMVQDYIGDANIDVPFVGNVNVPNAVVNTALDTAFDLGVPGLGVLSTIANPTQVETSWGTPFNTGGGGLIGVIGQASLNNLENIYGEAQAGTEGYDFYAPGDLPGTSTPIGLSPGLFGFGTVVSGNTQMMPEQADLNKDGVISATEVAAFADPTSPGAQAFQEIEDNKAASNQQLQDYYSAKAAAGENAFYGGSVVTDSQGNAVTSTDQKTGESIPVTSGGVYGAPPASTTSSSMTNNDIVDAIVSGMNNAAANPNPAGSYQVASSGNIVSDAGSSDSGMSSSESAASGGYAETVSGGGEFGGTSGPATSAADYNSKDGDTSSSNNDGGGSSDGGGKSIVCTEMYRQTGLDDWAKAMKVWDVYQKKHLTKFHEIGYHWLFKPYVKGMRKSNSMTKLGAYLAKERTQHLKHVMTKGRAKESIVGNIWCKIIHPVVYVAGKIKKES